jgi:hypothetical protein
VDSAALGPCSECGFNEVGELQSQPIELAVVGMTGVMGTYFAVCRRCRHLRFYLPAVLEAEDEASANESNA